MKKTDETPVVNLVKALGTEVVSYGAGKGPRCVQITWVERGTNKAACLGFDELIDIKAGEDANLSQIKEAAECYASNGGIDLDRYECRIEVLE